MGFLVSIFLKVFTSSTLSFISQAIGQLSNAQIAAVQARAQVDKAKIDGVIGAEEARIAAQGSVTLASMSHPIWWVGWALFVIPAGLYAALIHFKSLACTFYLPACEWNILRIPATTEAWDQMVVLSFFGLAATTSVVSVIASKIGK